MIALFASLSARPEHRDALEAALREMVGPSRAEPGNLRYDLFARADGSPAFDLFELYADAQAVEAHRQSPHYQAFRARIGDWLAAPVEVRLASPLELAPLA